MLLARGFFPISPLLLCIVFVLAGCSGNGGKSAQTPPKNDVSKTKEMILGKWKHEKDKTLIILEFTNDKINPTSDKLIYRNNKPGSGPPGATPYKVLDDKTLEMPKLGEVPTTEKVTIDSLSADKLVLSGGDTWKFDKTEFTKEK